MCVRVNKKGMEGEVIRKMVVGQVFVDKSFGDGAGQVVPKRVFGLPTPEAARATLAKALLGGPGVKKSSKSRGDKITVGEFADPF